MSGKRRFGRVRRLPSGRWPARYKGPDDINRPAPGTLAAKADAERWLSLAEAERWAAPMGTCIACPDWALPGMVARQLG